MARARFPGKPLRLQQRRRVALFSSDSDSKAAADNNCSSKKKTVTFGAVEACESRREPSDSAAAADRPLVSIIKKKSAFEPLDSAVLLRPAKLTKLSFDLLKRPKLVLTCEASDKFDGRRSDESDGLDSDDDATTSDSSDSSGSTGSTDSTDSSDEEEKRPARKVVLREARLQFNANPDAAGEGPFSAFKRNPDATDSPGTVTCGVCGALRFYRFVRQARKFGVYSCESCRKFISKIIKQNVGNSSSPQPLQCVRGDGTCRVPPIIKSQQSKLVHCAYSSRCHACWLRMCINAFQVSAALKTSLTNLLPPYMRTSTQTIDRSNLRLSYGSLSDDRVESVVKNVNGENAEKIEKEEPAKRDKFSSKNEIGDSIVNGRKRRHTRIKVRKKERVDVKPQVESNKRQKVELKGPRVKHVCRSASIVLGQPIATFPSNEEKGVSDVSDDIPTVEVEREEIPREDVERVGGDSETTAKDRTREDKTDAIKDDESNDSCDSLHLKETNKENDAYRINQGTDSEKDDVDSKTDVEQPCENVLQRKSKQPLGNLSNVRFNSKHKYSQQRQTEMVSTDFWETYDPDEVCNRGWGLIGSVPFTVYGVCFLCGSRGKEKLIYCMGCCEVYHPFCAEIGEESVRSWLCPRCVQCAGCSRNGAGPASTICRVCHRHFHASCLAANRPKNRSDWPQMCSSCLKCKSCDSFKVTKFLGNLPFCLTCFRLRQKGNYCPLCQGCYQDNDFDSKMMECGWCSRWVHARCEGLSGEGYQLVSALPQSIEYICKQCLPENAPWRKMMNTYFHSKLMSVLKALAKNKIACTLLKLTPHKNTPVSKRTCICSSSVAVRKLQFDDSSSYSNALAISNTKSKSDRDMGECNADTSKDQQLGKIKGTVHKLQESSLQNKEICLSMGPCLAGSESVDLLKEKYCCAETKSCSQSDNIHECVHLDGESENSPSLLDIKTRVNEYASLKDFNKDILEVISRMQSPEVNRIYKEVFAESFPWFDCELNCLNPSLEIEEENDDDALKDDDVSIYSISKNSEKIADKISVNDDRQVPSSHNDFKTLCDYSYEDDSLYDSRMCVLCKVVGEGNPSMEERLLYCGQGDWIHANCALWSAEVFEEIDGSLQNVQSAIARGKMIKCSKCLNKGASVGCCAKNCSETYHFTCARNIGCALLDDKRVFCPSHVSEAEDKVLQKDNDFVLSRPVYVELDRKKKKYCEPQKVQFLLGSLTVKHLGKIVPSVSDFDDVLIPADFLCSRLYWSTKQPWKIVKYTIRTKLLVIEPSPAYDLGVNITLDHSMNPSTVDRILAEIEAWHKSLDFEGLNSISLKKDKSPLKFGNAYVSLEDYAVKQVMEYMLDIVCKHDNNEDTPDEEPQNTADLLPPELKDAIFEDLNHDLLEGISMQDIFPKLCYEDLVAMDLKNEIGFGNDITRENKMSENVDDNNIPKQDDVTTSLHEKLRKSGFLLNSDPVDSKVTPQDFLEEFINNQNDTNKDIKRSKSDLLFHSANLKTISNRNQRSCNLTWNYKLDSAFKRCKLPRSNILTRSDGSGNVVMIVDGTSELVSSINPQKLKFDEMSEPKNQWQNRTVKGADEAKDNAHSSPLFFKNINTENECSNDSNSVKLDKSDNTNDQVIDFYTKMRCSPIAQLDGADDFNLDSMDMDYSSIPQLDGADDASSSSCSEGGSPPRDQNPGIFFRPSSIDNMYTMTISAANLNNLIPSNEILIRPALDDNIIRPGQCEQTVKCDRCHCTYRNKDSFNRHLPTCDMMSTSESEGETPKSPESRTLTTLQNAFNGQFVAPAYINQQNQFMESSDQFGVSKPTLVSTRRTSINTRQITINGTIVETPSPGPQSPLKLNDSGNCSDLPLNIKSSIVQETPKLTLGPGILSQPQIMVATNLPVSPPRNQTPNGSKCGIIPNQNNIPYSICVKPSSGLHTIQSTNSTLAHMLPNTGNIQTVFSSNPGQMLTIANPQQNIIQNIQGKAPFVQTFANIPNGQTLTVPMNSIQGLSTNNFVRPSLPLSTSSTLLVSPANTLHGTSTNLHQKSQILLPQVGQKSPKKLQQVQPKPIFQAARGRSRSIPKTSNAKKQAKHEKPFATINSSMTANGAVIQFQPNGGTNQPSIILQQVPNTNVVSYVEAIQQQHGPNMQYIATIAPQGDFKPAPTHYITQSGILPQTFQIQQTESGGLIAVPSNAIPVFLPQGGVGILPQSQSTLQTQGGTPILQQGAIQSQNGTTILPQATIQTQNGATIIPQAAALQSVPNNSIQSQAATIVPHNNTQNIAGLSAQNNTIISPQANPTIIPQGAILPQGLQFCNDQVLLGSTPTLEMVTDSTGCMYLTTQPVYYGLETIVQNTVMSSQQFVSTAMQGVLAQNSSFSATTTQVFQASKIEPIVEVPTGYVVVNNVPQDGGIVVSQSNGNNSQTMLSTQSLQNGISNSTQSQKSNKMSNGPNVVEKSNTPIGKPASRPLPVQSNQQQQIFNNTVSLQPRSMHHGKNITVQPMTMNVVQSANVSANQNTDNQQLLPNNLIGGTNVQLKISPAPFGNQLNLIEKESNMTCQSTKNLPRQCWQSNQNLNNDNSIKSPSIIIQSNEMQNNISPKVSINNSIISVPGNSTNLNMNPTTSNRNFMQSFSQPIFNEIQSKPSGQSPSPLVIGSGNGNCANSCSYGSLIPSNNFSMSSPTISSPTPYTFSNPTNQPNQIMNKGPIGDLQQSNQTPLICDKSANNKSQNHQTCSVHRHINTSNEMLQNNNSVNNFVSLGGKVYHISANNNNNNNNNNVPHISINNPLSTNIQSQINCGGVQTSMNSGNLNNISTNSGSLLNNRQDQIEGTNTFHGVNENINQMSCSNNINNVCSQHLIDNQNQIINLPSNQQSLVGHHGNITTSHGSMSNCGVNHLQVINANNYQMQVSKNNGGQNIEGKSSEIDNERLVHINSLNCNSRNNTNFHLANPLMQENRALCDANTVPQYQINNDQMFLINNSANNLNISSQYQNQSQTNITENLEQNAVQHIGKPILKSESLGSKNISNLTGVLQSDNLQINSNSQVLNFPDSTVSNTQFNTQRNQSTSVLSMDTSLNCNITDGKSADMPSLMSSNSTPGLHSNKQIHLPHHNISNNCQVNFPMSNKNVHGYANMQINNNMNQINLPSQNNGNISLPVQNTVSITLPKAPTHQSGIPTNVVNPIPQYMRPMNRVLPIHRDIKSPARPPKVKVELPKSSPRCQDMPELNAKEDEISTENEKVVRETKSTSEQKKSVVVVVSENIISTIAEDNKRKEDVQITSVKIAEANCDKNPSVKGNSESDNAKPPLPLKVDQKMREITQPLKENSIIVNLSSQRKVQLRNKIGSENVPLSKMMKQPPSCKVPRDDGPKLIYEISSEDGFTYSSASLSDLWNKVLEAVQNARKQHGFPSLKFGSSQSSSGTHILGLNNNALRYLIEQLPGAGRCMKYRSKQGSKVQMGWDSDTGMFESFRESSWGTARAGPAIRKSSTDMFSWLASPYRDPPPPLTISQDDSNISRRTTSTTLPIAMRFRNLKETSKSSVGVYRSRIHGRGLFCRRDIEAGEMVIEYAGEVIRASLADQRERRYEAARGGRGVTGCYMFRVDDNLVVDATMKGNAARFINHSCDPNCYSKVVDILGHKHILILALRRVYQGEELTYDYKFPFEEVKIPCTCGSKKCRKYLN